MTYYGYWYQAEAWLELNRLVALCGGRAVLFLCLQHYQKLAAVAKFSGIFNIKVNFSLGRT